MQRSILEMMTMSTATRSTVRRSLAILAAVVTLAWGAAAQAHCDTLDGPVVGAARTALDTGNPSPVLGWVQKKDEAEIRRAFEETVAVRKAGGAVKDLADKYFFETLVRVHRAGEGAPYTGLKPAGQPEPAVAAADQAIESGKLEGVAKMLTGDVHEGLHQKFEAVMAKKQYKPNDVAARREFAAAYVDYVHYVERLHDAAQVRAAAHAPVNAAAHAH
jgi:uncharacterized protein DUF6448